MVDHTRDVGFFQDISQLDNLRKQAIHGDKKSETSALTSAAKQFESIFTNMLMKSMRDSNSAFKSDLMHSQTQDFYQKMWDEQMSSELSSSGSLGLADMIVKQLSTHMTQPDTSTVKQDDQLQMALEKVRAYRERTQASAYVVPAMSESDRLQQAETGQPAGVLQVEPSKFESPQTFIQTLKPYAEKAAKALGVEPTLLLAQAALETGWGAKVVKNAAGSSFNLFNIKADRRWKGDKVTTQTLEYQGKTPVIEKSAFRAYDNYQDSFNDYVNFLESNPRYTTALNRSINSDHFIRNIHQAGYATDPNYSDKVLKLKDKIDRMN